MEKRVLLGDAIAALTSLAGISECGGCAKRRKALNTITPQLDDASKREVISLLAKAIFDPDSVKEEESDNGDELDNGAEIRVSWSYQATADESMRCEDCKKPLTDIGNDEWECSNPNCGDC